MAESGKKLFRKVLFLELAGVASLIATLAVIAYVVIIHTIPLQLLLLPLTGLVLAIVYIALTIGYMRKDLHRIHELHEKKIYSVGRFVVYLASVALVVWAAIQFTQTKDFWSDISAVVFSLTCILIAIFTTYYTITLGYLIQHEHLRHSGVSFWDLVILVLLPLGLVAFSVFTMFSQTASTSIQGEADFQMPVPQIIAEFEQSADSAALKYVGKSFAFGGLVSEVAGDSAVLLKLASGVDEYTVNCGFDKSEYAAAGKVVVGDSVSLKCSCSGLTLPEDEMSLLSEKSLDMVRCSLVNLTKK